MNETIDRSALSALIKEYGGVDSYTTTQAVTLFKLLIEMTVKQGLDPGDRAQFLEGIGNIFNFEFVNMPDLSRGRYLLAPNHVSEFDGLIYGIMIPNTLVVAKSDWVSNPNLNQFVNRLFSVVGIIRKDNQSGMNALRRCIEHLKASEDSAVTIFVQQTIADIDNTVPDDVASGAFYIAKKAGAKVIPVYGEQVSPDAPTRIVFGEPIECANKNQFGEAWLKCEIAMRDSISDPAARPPMLCEKHRKPISQREF